jgi:hypothetical protein
MNIKNIKNKTNGLQLTKPDFIYHRHDQKTIAWSSYLIYSIRDTLEPLTTYNKLPQHCLQQYQNNISSPPSSPIMSEQKYNLTYSSPALTDTRTTEVNATHPQKQPIYKHNQS